jgi:hypothetical protein
MSTLEGLPWKDQDKPLICKELIARHLLLGRVARLSGTQIHASTIDFNLTLDSFVSATSATQGPAQNASRPLRMVTLLIEDMRSGVLDSQLAEVKVPLRVAGDPEDGFWADAAEICDALQGGPSRIDGCRSIHAI